MATPALRRITTFSPAVTLFYVAGSFPPIAEDLRDAPPASREERNQGHQM